jgi:hypothetical protein
VCHPGRPSPTATATTAHRLGLLPDGEVEGRPLRLVHLDPSPRAERLEVLAGQQAVPRDLGHREVDAVVGLVGDAAVDEATDQRDHAVDVGGRVGVVVGAADAEPVHRVVPGGLELGGDLGRRATVPSGAGDDLVVDVGDVRHVADLEARPLEVPAEDVPHEAEPAVPDVGHVRHGDAADVDGRLPRLPEVEGPDGAGGGVMQAEHPTRLPRGPGPARGARTATGGR